MYIFPCIVFDIYAMRPVCFDVVLSCSVVCCLWVYGGAVGGGDEINKLDVDWGRSVQQSNRGLLPWVVFVIPL